MRLTERGREVGLVSDERYNLFCEKKNYIDRVLLSLERTFIKPSDKDVLSKLNIEIKDNPYSWKTILKRPGISFNDILKAQNREKIDENLSYEIEMTVKYEGYIHRQEEQVQNRQRLEKINIPEDIDYRQIVSLSRECIEKLEKIRPSTLGQASRISGITPVDISLIMIYLKGN